VGRKAPNARTVDCVSDTQSAWLVVLGILALIGVGQWWVTRPSKRRPIDTSQARAEIEAEYGKSNDIIRGQGLP
jgi:hypothetical protein